MTKPRCETVREFIQAAGARFVSVGFYKKDGSERWIVFNPRDWNEIKGTGKACEDPDVFRIRETKNKEEGKASWRSFRASKVFCLRADGKELVFD